MSRKVVLITGASSGIGLATSMELLGAGHIVYGGARRTAEMEPIVRSGGVALPLDVTDEAAMTAAVDRVLAEQGRIDVLINNAGYPSYGAVEDVPVEESRAQIEVNVVGLARMTQLVLPHMRARGSGRIVNVSSMGGTIWTPLGAWYHGTKWFVEGFSNALRLELAPFGVDVVIMAPGAIDTGFNGVMIEKVEKASGGGPYGSLVEALGRASAGNRGSSPDVVARAIRQAIETERPYVIYRPGRFGRLLPLLARALPAGWFDRLVGMMVR